MIGLKFIIEVLKTMHSLKEEGKTTLFVTHNKEEMKICDMVYAIENQQIIEKE
ncbi:hypothetical protein N9312_01495 [Bacteroidia bacterium]|jgi:ABC-type lipoprotein export system ATPase subunit|nr:hypothetical protein [Bacteroidia bacterium]